MIVISVLEYALTFQKKKKNGNIRLRKKEMFFLGYAIFVIISNIMHTKRKFEWADLQVDLKLSTEQRRGTILSLSCCISSRENHC